MFREIVVDSSFFIRSVNMRQDPFEILALYADSAEFIMTGVVWVEVLRGRTAPRLKRHFEERFSTMVFHQTTARTWQRAAELAWQMDRQGKTIQATDITIATCALERGAAVLTFDRHFHDVPGLAVIDDLD